MVQELRWGELLSKRQGPGDRLHKARSDVGQVLLIMRLRIVFEGQSKEGTRKVASQEFDSVHGLKHLYSSVRRQNCGVCTGIGIDIDGA